MKKYKFNWLFGLVCSFLLLYGCATVPVDLSRGSILGEGGLLTTREVKARHKQELKALSVQKLSFQEEQVQKQELLQKQDQENQAAISKDFQATMADCNKIFSRFERTANTFRWTSFGIAMVGTIAGAVIVPALTAANAAAFKVTIAAFGGLSGAANAAQGTLTQQGLTAEETIKARDQLRSDFKGAMNDYFKAKDEGDKDKQEVGLERAAVACISYAVQSASTTVQTKSDSNQPGSNQPNPK